MKNTLRYLTLLLIALTCVAAPVLLHGQIIRTIAGNGTGGYSGDGGVATAAELYYPQAVAIDGSGNIYIADADNFRIRKMNISGVITTLAGNGTSGFSGDGGAATAAEISFSTGIAVDAANNVYIADEHNNRIRMVSASGIITTVAGNGTGGFSGDGGAATAAELNNPEGVAVDASGNLYIADDYNQRIRMVSASGIIRTIAGTGTSGFSGDGGAATSANLNAPAAVAVDAAGRIYISDYGNNRIRVINASGIVSTFAGNGTAGFTGDGGYATAAELHSPSGINLDAAGNLYVADYQNGRIRKIATSGIISTVAGNGSAGFSGDGGAATAAALFGPLGVALDAAGNIIICDYENNRIRKVTVGPTYCSPSFFEAAYSCSTMYTNISGFHVIGTTATNINDRVACDGSGYEVHTAMSSTFAQGGSYTATINTSGTYSLTCQSWIDFNNNGTFESSESVGGISSYTDSGTFSITIPASAPTGTFRLRVEEVYGAASYPSVAPCPTSYYYGEVRDYTVNIVTPATRSITASPDTLAFSGCLSAGSGSSVMTSTLTGSYLVPTTGTITVTAPADFQVSPDGATWVTSYTVTYSGGAVSTPINVEFFPVTAGVHTGNITITGDSTTEYIYLTGNEPPVVTAIVGPATVPAGSTITLVDTTSGGTWSSASGSIATVGATGVVTGVSVGSTTISYVVTNGCGTTVVTYGVLVTGSISSSCNIITTIAGNGSAGYSGDGGVATSAGVNYLRGVAMDGSGNIYIADGNNRIRKITTSGVISTIAGNGTAGFAGDGGAATAAELNSPWGVAVDLSGNIYIGDFSNSRLRKINTSGIISTIAGNGTVGYTGDGGPASSAEVSYITDVMTDAGGNIYFADEQNYRVRKINTAGIISTVAGNGSYGFSGDGGLATAASLSSVYGIGMDPTGNLLIADYNNNRIRKVNASGIINTIAGNGTGGYAGDGGAATAAELSSPSDVAADAAGDLFIADAYNHRVREVNASGIMTTVAGGSTAGFTGDGGAATAAEINLQGGLIVDATSNIYFTDAGNYRLRKITSGDATVAAISGPTTVVAGATVTLTDATSGGTWNSSATSLATVSGSGVVGGVAAGSATISYAVTNTCGTNVVTYGVSVTSTSTCTIITTVVGTGTAGFAGDGAAATTGEIDGPTVVNFDTLGNMYIADYLNNRIRKVSTSGIMTTVAGNGTAGYSGDGGPATAAELNEPSYVVVRYGSLYIADYYGHRIRKVSPTGIMSTVAGNGTGGYSGDGGAATAAELYYPTSVTFDAGNNMYIADEANNLIRKVTPSGIISTFAGGGSTLGDGGPATAASLNRPGGVACDASGNIFITDAVNQRIRKVATSGIITTYCGNGTAGYTGDGGAATAAEVNHPLRLMVDAGDNVYFGDVNNNRIRKITAAGIITTIAGNGTAGFSGDGGPATAAELSGAQGVAMDASGNIFLVDVGNARVRKIGPGTAPYVATPTGVASLCARDTISLIDSTAGGTWTSSNTTIATVNALGVVGGVAGGTATISYSVTNACGTSVTTKSITVLPQPVISALTAASSTICVGSGEYITDTVSGGTWSSSNTSVAMVTSAGYVTGVTSGTAIISYIVTNSCGSALSTFNITITAAPAAGTVSGATAPCIGSPATYTDGLSGGTWNTSNHSVATISAGGVLSGITTGADSVEYTVTNTCGTAQARLLVTIGSAATPAAISGTATVCTGATTSLSDSTTGGTWTSGNTSIATVGTTGIVTGVAAGTVNITYTVTSSCGSAYAIKAVTVTAAPTVAAISGTATVCSGNTTTLTDATGSGTWSSSNTSIATVSGGGVVGGVAAGSATISYTVTSTCGSRSATLSMTVSSAPAVPAISGASSLCTGTSTTLTDGTSGGTWTSSPTAVATVNASGTVYGVTAGTANITYSVTNTCGTTTVTQSLTVNSLASAGTITGTPSTCTGSTATLTDGTTGGTWASSNSAIASVSASGVVTGITAGTATITYTVTSTCGTAIATQAFTVNAAPAAGSITGVASVCSGSSITLTDAAGGGTWSSSAGTIASVSASGLVTGISAGSAIISYTVTTSCGTAVATHALTVNPAPSAGAITGPAIVCTGATITLADATTGGTWSSSNAALATVSSTGVVTGVATGTVGISYSVTTACGTSVAGAIVSVSTTPSAGTITGPAIVCSGSTITLTDAAAGGTWSSSTPAKATVNSTGVVTGVAAGTVTISYTVTSACATATTTSTLTVSAAASAGTITGLAAVCTGANITLTATGTAGGSWISGNPAVATVAAGVVHGLTAGVVTISYSVTTGCGTVYATKSITVSATPTVTAISGATNICLGATSTFTDGTAGGGWISSSTAIATVNSAGVVTAIGAGTATLTYFVTNTCGTATTTKVITINTLNAGVISGAASVAVGASTTLTNTVTGGVWSSTLPSIATIGATGLVTGVAIGADSIKYTVTNVCGTAVAKKAITVTAHRDELPGATTSQGAAEASINLYPNPNSGTFTLELTGTSGPATVIITDLSGRVLENTTSSEPKLYFDLSRYAAGTYIVKVNVDGNEFSKKVLVN